ncbi:MAG TPA: hypothetical protein VKD02_05720 [Methyloceanibacter sp.]|nr:hypothetical protein [Methyloceanibacter sp.]
MFTDIDMPGSMDGLSLAHVIRKRWPPIELIVTSGVNDMPERARFFSKPYSDREIVSPTPSCRFRRLRHRLGAEVAALSRTGSVEDPLAFWLEIPP